MYYNTLRAVEKGYIFGLLNIKNQVQGDGVDLTLYRVRQLYGSGKLSINTSIISPVEEIFEDSLGFFTFEKGNMYDLILNEGISIPNNLVARIYPRSSLVRMGGSITSGLYDSLYKCDHVGCFLYAARPFLIEKNARVVQLSFQESDSCNGYSGQFQGGQSWIK